MKHEKPTAAETGNRWLRVGVLTFTVAGPIIKTLVEFMRQPKQSPEEQAEEIQNKISISEAMALSQLDDVSLARRQRVAEQARELRKQSRQLRSQAQRSEACVRGVLRPCSDAPADAVRHEPAASAVPAPAHHRDSRRATVL